MSLSKKVSKPLNIYISKSMLTDISVIRNIKERLSVYYPNSNIYYYTSDISYNPELVKRADLVLSLPDVETQSFYTVGKGQYDEFELAQKLRIPVFRVNRNSNFYRIHNNNIIDLSSWKRNYGMFRNDTVPIEKQLLFQMLTFELVKESELLLICNIK